jgi:hypothetical protein
MITVQEGIFFTSDSILKEISEFEGQILTRYYLTLESIGLETTDVHMNVKCEGYILCSLTSYDFTLIKHGTKKITLNVSTPHTTPPGNYTITVNATESGTNAPLGSIDLYYLVVPELNITEIKVSEDDPKQNKEVELTASIINSGLVDARNVTLTFYDGSEKIDSVELGYLNVSENADLTVEWTPTKYGNRTIKAVIDVEGVGDFGSYGIDLESESTSFDVQIDWEPYYLAIYIVLLIILGIGVVSGISGMRYVGAAPTGSMEGEQYESMEGIQDTDYRDVEPVIDEPLVLQPEPQPVVSPSPPIEEKPIEVKPQIMPLPPREPRRKPQQRVKPLSAEDNLKGKIETSQIELEKAKSLGMDVTMIEQLLDKARKTYKENDFDKTEDYLRYVSERLENLMDKRNEAIMLIRTAREAIAEVKGTTDVTIAENFLVKASSLLEQGNYREAINYANKAKDRVGRKEVRHERDEPRL